MTMLKAMKNTTAMILAGSLVAGGLLACSEETKAPEDQASLEQPAANEGESVSYSVSEVSEMEETAPMEPTPLQNSPELDASMSPSERAFTALDANQDTLLDEQEVSVNATIHQDFEAIDLDQNGMVSLNEFMVYAGEATAAGVESSEPAMEEAVPAE